MILRGRCIIHDINGAGGILNDINEAGVLCMILRGQVSYT